MRRRFLQVRPTKCGLSVHQACAFQGAEVKSTHWTLMMVEQEHDVVLFGESRIHDQQLRQLVPGSCPPALVDAQPNFISALICGRFEVKRDAVSRGAWSGSSESRASCRRLRSYSSCRSLEYWLSRGAKRLPSSSRRTRPKPQLSALCISACGQTRPDITKVASRVAQVGNEDECCRVAWCGDRRSTIR